MFSRIFKIAGLIVIAIVFANNIYMAVNFYNMSSIHLSDKFYQQSGDVKLVDNKIEKIQTYGECRNIGKTYKKENLNGKVVIIYLVKRDSYRKNW